MWIVKVLSITRKRSVLNRGRRVSLVIGPCAEAEGGRRSLLAPSYCSAGFAAVALAMVAMAADEKERATAGATTKAWSERSFRRVPFRCLDFRSHLITIHESRTTGLQSYTRRHPMDDEGGNVTAARR